jgi:hypothetical protein
VQHAQQFFAHDGAGAHRFVAALQFVVKLSHMLADAQHRPRPGIYAYGGGRLRELGSRTLGFASRARADLCGRNLRDAQQPLDLHAQYPAHRPFPQFTQALAVIGRGGNLRPPGF